MLLPSTVKKNFLTEEEFFHFFNLGRAYYDPEKAQVLIKQDHKFAFFFYEDAPALRNEISIPPKAEYLKGKVDIPYIKARKFLKVETQRNLQGIINWIFKHAEETQIEERYNIAQIGFSWGRVDRHSHNMPSHYPGTTVTYFINLEGGQGLDFHVYSEVNQVQSYQLCAKTNCTRVTFDSNLDHELLNKDKKLYMFVLFNSVKVKSDSPKILDINIPMEISVL